MAKIADVDFNGKIGKYKFEVYPLDTKFNCVGAVYIFTKRLVNAENVGSHELIYIGQTESLADRIPTHEKWPCVNKNNANCICVHLDENEKSRLDKETDLRAANKTQCNDQ